MKKLLGLLLITGSFMAAQAQDSTSVPPLFSGYADVYYKYNFNKNVTDNKTSFTNSQNSFELGMISLKIRHAIGKVSFLGDIGFGKRVEEFSYTDKNTSLAIKQLYMSYAPASWIKFTAGSFATHVGYELVDANLNRNYSMSYMFSYGPFFHTGVKADLSAGAHTFMLGIFNPTDYKYAPLNSKKYLGAQWGFAPGDGAFHSYLNYIGGEDTAGVRNDQLDLVLTLLLSSHFNLAYDGTYSRYRYNGDNSAWYGSAVYLNADISEHTGLTLRVEYFCDKDKLKVFTDPVKFPSGGSIWSYTLSGNFKASALTVIPELRLDHSTRSLFTRDGSAAASSPSALIAAIYSF